MVEGFTLGESSGATLGQSTGGKLASYPRTPTNLAVVDTRLDEIDLSWDNDGYWDSLKIYRSTTSGSTVGDYTNVATLNSVTETHTDTGLSTAEEYFYRVSTVRGGIESDLSSEVSGVTQIPAPQIDSIDDTTEDQLTVNWTLNDSSPDGDVEVYRSETSGTLGSVVATITNLSTVSYTDTGLEDGERYFYTIRRNVSTNSSDSSQQDAITILPSPSGISFTQNYVTSVAISWTNNDDSSDGDIEIYSSTDGTLGTLIKDGLSPGTTSYTDNNATTGDTVYYTVRRQTDHANTEVQGSVQTDGISGPKEKMSWRSESDWNNATTIKASSQPYSGNDKEQIVLGFTEEWDIEGLKGLYTFDSSDGTLYDRSGNGFDGTVASTLTYGKTGVNGGEAWGFDGSDDARVDLPNMGIFGDTDITLLTIFKPNTNTEDQMLITVGGDDDRDQIALLAHADCTGYKYSAGTNSFSGSDTRSVDTADFSGQWTVAALVYDASESEFRVNHNGSNIETFSYGSDMKIHNTRYRIGSAEIGRTSAGDPIRGYDGDMALAGFVGNALSTSTLSDIADTLTYGKIVTEGRRI